MTTRPTRSSSIPIPRTTSMSSAARNVSIETAIPITFTAGIRPRLPIISPTTHRMNVLPVAPARLTSSAPAPSPAPTTRSFTSSVFNRPSLRSHTTTTFEPRVIRADPACNSEVQCPPSTSGTQSPPRRASAGSTRLSTSHLPSGYLDRHRLQPTVPPFPRPSYLDYSALRHRLVMDDCKGPASMRSKADVPAMDVQLPMARRPASMSPSTDSGDEDSSQSPPREQLPAPITSVLHDPVLHLPTRWCEQVRHPLLTVSGDGRDLTYHGPSSSGEKDAAAARTAHCIPPACGVYYYEVEIVSKGQKGHISIGFAGRDVRLSRLPGWERNSWGYHGDDGYSFAAERNGTPYGPTFGTGDIIGCGIDFSQNKVFYTKNGTYLGPAFDNVGKDCDIFPSVGLRHSGEAVRVNFGHEPFKFDIDYHVQQQRNYTWAKIQSTSLDRLLAAASTDSGTKKREKTPSLGPKEHVSDERVRTLINHLVLEYLAHHGYADTARAFREQFERREMLGIGVKMDGAAGSCGDVEMKEEGGRDEECGIGLGWASVGMEEGEMELRTRIVGAVIAGDIDTALAETKEHYPAVLEQDDGLMRFKLRCRKFVEMILEASEKQKQVQEESVFGDGVVVVGEEGSVEDDEDEERMVMIGVGADVDGMDVDEDAPMSSSMRMTGTNGYVAVSGPGDDQKLWESSPGPTWNGGVSPYEAALRKVIDYGRSLYAEYKNDQRPEVRAISTRTFSLLLPKDPAGAGGEMGDVVGHEMRVALANELNQAILKSQGQPGHPALEMLYRQTGACIVQLGLSGVGAAAFADMSKEFLDA